MLCLLHVKSDYLGPVFKVGRVKGGRDANQVPGRGWRLENRSISRREERALTESPRVPGRTARCLPIDSRKLGQRGFCLK